MKKTCPQHPGASIRSECLELAGLTVTAAAKALGVSRQALNNVINGQAAISPEMAIRLEKSFACSAETWLQLQAEYDIARAKRLRIKFR